MKTDGGRFNPNEKNIYFIAGNAGAFERVMEQTHHMLIAVNEIAGDESRRFLDHVVEDPRKRLFLDSGVFNLAMTYARKHKVSHNDGLSMAPDEIEGFQDLFEKYVKIVQTYKEHLWGYIEIDQGGRDNKIKTRARLEALGLKPIPVYHPFHDGWDYFDHLAQNYDRICFGNVVKATMPERRRLAATAWERHRKYPHLWIHFLGLSPNQWLNAFPMNSGDSSSWLTPIRWPIFYAYTDGAQIAKMSRGYYYQRRTDVDSPRGQDKELKLLAYQARMRMLVWRGHLQKIQGLGAPLYPAHSSKEAFVTTYQEHIS